MRAQRQQLERVRPIYRWSATAVLVWALLATASVGAAGADAVRIGDPVRVMPLGDGITDGATGSADSTGYRRSLYQELTGYGHKIEFVGGVTSGVPVDFDRDHEGHAGLRADGVADSITSWLDANPADLILLHVGTEDIGDGQSAQDVVNEIEALLDSVDVWETANATEVTVFLAQIINRSEPDSLFGVATSALNDSILARANTRIAGGDKIVVVDHESALTYPDDLTDEVYPNDTGYGLMADAWFDAVHTFLGGPGIENVVLSSTSGNGLTGDDLTVSYGLTGTAVAAATAWYQAGSRAPVMSMYLPMEGGATLALDDYSGGGYSATASGDPTWGEDLGYDGTGCSVVTRSGRGTSATRPCRRATAARGTRSSIPTRSISTRGTSSRSRSTTTRAR